MREVVMTVYQYDELSDEAKAKARDWFREGDIFQPNMEPYETAAKLLGITFGTRRYKTVGGGEGSEPAIYWRGFSSQGDGASFEGTYEYVKGMRRAIRKEFPVTTTLHKIADRLAELQKRYRNQLTATITQSGHYVHKYTMSLGDVYRDTVNGHVWVESDADRETLLDIIRDFAQWIYNSLQSEYEEVTSDEYVADTIRANEYEFCASGKRARGC